MKDLIIIGAGAAGLYAGTVASANNVDTLIIEHTDNLGKKILSTGNGKCNITNLNLSEQFYYCKDSSFINNILNRVDSKKIINDFLELGLITRQRDGYVYPYSEQATAVNKMLIDACNKNNVNIEKNCKVASVRYTNNIFEVTTDKGVFSTKKLLIATGGKSFPKSGSDGSGYELAKSFNHTINKTVPALTSLICNEKHYKQISGVRAKCKIKLVVNNNIVAMDEGELQLTDYGISGIPVFNLSRHASYALKERKNTYAIIDFLKDYNEHDFKEILLNFKKKFPDRSVREQLSLVLNSKLALYFVNTLGIGNMLLDSLTEEKIQALIREIKEYKTKIINIKSYDFAQVTAGGISTQEICSKTMESKIQKNLYFAGEIIDVDGRCGGYNLHFAWATAYIAAMSIAKEL